MLDLGEKMRKLYSANTPCHAGCQYCFARWNDIYDGQPLFENVIFDNDSIILYPCCDGEFFEQNNIINKIKDLTNNLQKVYISVSTKRNLSSEETKCLISLNKWLRNSGKGFVKVSVSVSTKTMLSEIEPNAATYSDRLLIANRLKEAGIYVSLNIKPILPFIADKEYFEILNDFSPYIQDVMLGGLYVNPSSSFYKEYIQDKYSCTKRKVHWLDNCPEWYYVEDEKKTIDIISCAENLGMHVYQSDEDFINSIRKMG